MAFNIHYKHEDCTMVFWQIIKHDDEQVRYLELKPRQTEVGDWQLMSRKQLLTDRKLSHCKRTLLKVYIRVRQTDLRPAWEIVDEYLQRADLIRRCSRVNPERIGSHLDTALYIFHKHCKCTLEMYPKGLSKLEQRWLDRSHRGGIIWGRPCTTEAYKYDFTSHYPSQMVSRAYPIGGLEKLLLPVDIALDLEQLAMYRVNVLTSHALWKATGEVTVTNVDLKALDMLGIKWELCPPHSKNGKPYTNGIRYTSVADGNDLFGHYVNTFFKLKCNPENTVSAVGKSMLNEFTGLLSSRKHQFGNLNQINLKKSNIISLSPDAIQYQNKTDELYKYPQLARLGIFVTAYGRLKLIECLTKYNALNNLLRVHTDGFLVTQPLPNEATATAKQLNGLKYEGFHKVIIENAMSVKYT